MPRKKILIIEDAEPMIHTYIAYLDGENYDITYAKTGEEALGILRNDMPDGILLDLHLPDMNGIEILKEIRTTNDECAIIVITGKASVNVAVEVMQEGANDFVAKPVSPDRLKVSLKNALETQRLELIAQTFETITRSSFCDFIGKSPKMQTIYSIIENAAQSKASVFITGESGTGKELAARAIHQMSPRISRNFEALNCAAIPHTLLESEIFGHIKGAFTGAIANREGAARRANKGTLFLDELGEMPIELQSKLLRFIQTGSFMAIGGSKLEEVDVRFVCATNINPLEAIKNKELREDLYYRLNVIPINMPSLRERGDDIILLAESFLKSITKEENKHFIEFSKDAKTAMLEYQWPGNVRELENVVRSAVVLNKGEEISLDMMPNLEVQTRTPQNILFQINEDSTVTNNNIYHLPENPNDIEPLELIEEKMIKAAINACEGNISKAARKLEINPSTIHRKIKGWGSNQDCL